MVQRSLRFRTSSVLSIFTGWALALVLGIRHASEPDHVVAVSTLVTDETTAARAAFQGAVWGLGHSISLFTVGSLLLMFRLRLSEGVAELFELTVAVMLLGLGLRSLMRAFSARREAAHVHPEHSTHAHEHKSPLQLARRPLAIGLVHGLAGSGALTALVLANMPSIVAGLVYMLCFGAGSIVGMALLTGAAGTPLRWLSKRRSLQAALGATAGAMSFGLGLSVAWPILSKLVSA